MTNLYLPPKVRLSRSLRGLSGWRCILPYLLRFLLWITIGLSPGHAGAPPAVTSANATLLPDLVEKVASGVVNISSTKFVKSYMFYGPHMNDTFFQLFGLSPEHIQKQSSLGSGFLIDTAGYILTNNHVIEQADEIMVILLDKRRLPAKLIGRDKALDLALIQLKNGSNQKNLKPVSLGDSENVRIGESVFAIGNPFGLQHTVTAGIISAKDRTIGLGAYDRFLQTDCSINFGNSGGPLFNFKGEVIGINTAINAQGQGLGFAIPIAEAVSHLDEFKKFGHVPRPWLGLLGQNITPALQTYYGLPVDHGVVVTNLVNQGPADRNGLRLGDILTSLNGQAIRETYDIQRILSKLKADDPLEIQLQRGQTKIKRQIKLKAAPNLDDLPQGIL